jgi:hypothetical protein
MIAVVASSKMLMRVDGQAAHVASAASARWPAGHLAALHASVLALRDGDVLTCM